MPTAGPRHEIYQQYQDPRPSASRRGYGAIWQRARAGFLKDHPLCKSCQSRQKTIPATVVDHIIPHKGDTSLFWDRANWQPLCERCHNRKSAREK